MVNSVSATGQNLNLAMPQKMKSPEEMFKQMSLEAGGDGTKITKEQLESLIEKKSSEGKDLGPLKDLLENFDTISNGNNSITAKDIDTAIQNGTLKPPKGPNGQPPADSRSDFQNPSTITKNQLEPPIDIRV